MTQNFSPKQTISPKVLVAVIIAGVVVLGLLGRWVYTAPSSTPAPAAERKAQSINPHAGGPTQADLQRMREYNATHPGASSSYK